MEKSFARTNGGTRQHGYGFKNSQSLATATVPPMNGGEGAEKNRPVKRFRAHGVEISVWENTSKNGNKYYTFTLRRSYKTESGEWKNSESLNQTDLLVAAFLMREAFRDATLNKDDHTETGQAEDLLP